MLEAETLRYSGSQVKELLQNDKTDTLRKSIITAIFEKASESISGRWIFES